MKGLSIRARLLVSSSVVLAGFLGLTGLALNQAFERSARAAAFQRLQSQVYMLLGAAEFDPDSGLFMPDRLPEPRLASTESGLYAQVLAEQGVVWRSQSTSGLRIPARSGGAPGDAMTGRLQSDRGDKLIFVSFPVDWETGEDKVTRYTFQIAEDERGLLAELGTFRRSLWIWLGAAGLALVLVQGVTLGWSISPLRRVARELREVEQGGRDRLSADYPRELRSLTGNLNQFIDQSRDRVERYRNALGNLAHSLKTPLAVVRGSFGEVDAGDQRRQLVLEQVKRMDQTIDYQLQRASALGRDPLAAPVAVKPVVDRLVAALLKVHATGKLELRVSVASKVRFAGDEGDLTEILGNLIDNACKWAAGIVVVTIEQQEGGGLHLTVEDDGPGIPQDRVASVLGRGQRLDPGIEGHGIGLAVVRDLVEEIYRGHLTINRSALGGSKVEAEIPAGAQ